MSFYQLKLDHVLCNILTKKSSLAGKTRCGRGATRRCNERKSAKSELKKEKNFSAAN